MTTYPLADVVLTSCPRCQAAVFVQPVDDRDGHVRWHERQDRATGGFYRPRRLRDDEPTVQGAA